MDRDVIARAAALESALRLPRPLGWLVAGADRHGRRTVMLALALLGILVLTTFAPAGTTGPSGLVIAVVRIALVLSLVALAARPAAVSWARRRLVHRAFPYTPELVPVAARVERLRSASLAGADADPRLARVDAHVRAETARLAAVVTGISRAPWAPAARAALASAASDASALEEVVAAVSPAELDALGTPQARDAAIAGTLARCGIVDAERAPSAGAGRPLTIQASSALEIMREVAAKSGERTKLELMLERMGTLLVIEQEERTAAADRTAAERRARAPTSGGGRSRARSAGVAVPTLDGDPTPKPARGRASTPIGDGAAPKRAAARTPRVNPSAAPKPRGVGGHGPSVSGAAPKPAGRASKPDIGAAPRRAVGGASKPDGGGAAPEPARAGEPETGVDAASDRATAPGRQPPSDGTG